MLQRTLCLLLLSVCTQAFAAPPTDESIGELLVLTRSESLLQQVHASVDQAIRQGLAQDVAGRTLTDAQRVAIEAAPARIGAVFRSEMSWDKMRPLYVAIYKESLDQAEVDGLVAFYKSPVGQAVVAKLPAVMQRTMAVTQLQMQALMPKIDAAMKEALQDAKLPPRS